MMQPISHEDAYSMLDLPGIKERFSEKPNRLSPKYAFFLVNDRMLVGAKAATTHDIEFHAMAPRYHWRHLRSDVMDMVGHMQAHGYQNIYTGINDQYRRTQNLARKCGFREIYRVGSEVIFRWLSQK